VPMTWRPEVSAVLFLVAVTPFLTPSRGGWLSRHRLSTLVMGATGISAVFLSAIVVSGSDLVLSIDVGVMLITLAAVEEIVFRKLLPRRLARVVGESASVKTRLIGVVPPVIAQATFATAHVPIITSRLLPFGAYEWSRLFAAGLLLAVIANLYGLWLAIGAHSSMNFYLLYGLPPSFSIISPFLLMMCISVALLVLAYDKRVAKPERDPVGLESLA
jgi:membrane protease YdiL (CAAX protease family)